MKEFITSTHKVQEILKINPSQRKKILLRHLDLHKSMKSIRNGKVMDKVCDLFII